MGSFTHSRERGVYRKRSVAFQRSKQCPLPDKGNKTACQGTCGTVQLVQNIESIIAVRVLLVREGRGIGYN